MSRLNFHAKLNIDKIFQFLRENLIDKFLIFGAKNAKIQELNVSKYLRQIYNFFQMNW